MREGMSQHAQKTLWFPVCVETGEVDFSEEMSVVDGDAFEHELVKGYEYRKFVVTAVPADEHQSLTDKLREAETARDRAEQALRANGYRKDCDIPACNCGPQWNHGGHANQRLSELSDALPYENGKTVLQRAQSLVEKVTELEQANAHLREIGSKMVAYHQGTIKEAGWTWQDLVNELKQALGREA